MGNITSKYGSLHNIPIFLFSYDRLNPPFSHFETEGKYSFVCENGMGLAQPYMASFFSSLVTA